MPSPCPNEIRGGRSNVLLADHKLDSNSGDVTKGGLRLPKGSGAKVNNLTRSKSLDKEVFRYTVTYDDTVKGNIDTLNKSLDRTLLHANSYIAKRGLPYPERLS